MTRKSDWMEQNHEALFDQSSLTGNYLDDHMDAFGISGTSADWVNNVFKVKWQAFSNAFQAWKDPSERTPKKSAMLNEAEEDFKPAYRQLYTGFLRNNPNVKDEDLLAMGLPLRNGTKSTPAPDPQTIPEAEVEVMSPGIVIIHFRDRNATKKAKPQGVHGAEIAWAVLDKAPVSVKELTNSAFDTKTPYQFSFDGIMRGKRLYFALRWENTRGVKGNWSDIFETVIP